MRSNGGAVFKPGFLRWFSNPFFALAAAVMMASSMVSRKKANNDTSVGI
jgi:hypothetical protein